jgi:hypothetical protein
MPKFLRVSVFLFAGIWLPAQQLPYPTYLNPKVLFAGGGATVTPYTIRVTLRD